MYLYKETHYRSIVKALSWRVVATLTTITIVYVFTHKLILSLGVGAVEVVAKLLFYYFHERIWGSIPLGQKKHPLSDLRVKGPIKPEDMEKIREQLKSLGYM